MTGEPRRDVRLALVLNGGVSLAIWIGGVTKEIDELRLSSEPEERRSGIGKTGVLYGELMDILQQRARVDVIAGASAGGINGILLASAIFSGKPLPDGLREIWIGLGDFRTLLRSPAERDSPSLLKGDDVVLTQLRTTVGEILAGWQGRQRPAESVFLFVTATDLLGRWLKFRDTTGRRFQERDHRRVLSFEYRPDDDAEPAASRGTDPPMPPTVRFDDEDAPELLARTGRATSSFPVAFEPHSLSFVGERPADKPDHRWLIDGGVLDNQPFNPVLDRISVLPSAVPVRRVVAYVVPYVNEVEGTLGREMEAENVEPTARQVYSASGALPRTLPKLESLERVLRERRAQQTAEEDRRRLWRVGAGHQEHVREAALALLAAYRRTLNDSARRMFEAWSADSFTPGHGVLAQSPSLDPMELPRIRGKTPPGDPPADTPWLPTRLEWRDDDGWRWELAVAERVAAWGLLFLRDAFAPGADEELRERILAARRRASSLIWEIRQQKQRVQQAFAEQGPGDPVERARAAYAREAESFVELKAKFVQLDDLLRAIGPELVPGVRDLLCLEVVRNAFAIDDPRVPFPFEFFFMSAGLGNALNHSANSPETKLAGMKAGHFGGFLKRSWRANDWLWGRLDGVQHVIRATIDLDWVGQLSQAQKEQLAAFAFPEGPELETLKRLAKERVERVGLDAGDSGRGAFLALLELALSHQGSDQETAIKYFRPCQGALAARIQLAVLEDDLARVAETAAEDVEAGSSRIAYGVRWAGRFYGRGRSLRRTGRLPLDTAERVTRFRELRIGELESLQDEGSSRAAIELGAQTIAVATGVFAGQRGGLPLVVRTALATARGVTLGVSGFVRLLAGSPPVGAGLLAVVAALVVWALVAPNVVLGALVPTLAALVVAGGYVLLNFATGALEQSINSWKRGLGALLLVGLPLAFLLAVGWPEEDPLGTVQAGLRSSVVERAGVWGTRITAAFALAAVLAASARLLAELGVPLAWRRRLLALYRLGFVGALVAAGAGFVVERWRADFGCAPGTPCTEWERFADERLGIVLFTCLVAAALFAAVMVELVIPAIVRGRDRRRAKRMARPPAEQ